MIVIYFLTGKQDGENPVKNITLEVSFPYYPRLGEYVTLDLPSYFSDKKTYYGEVRQIVHRISNGRDPEVQVYLS
jgi:hypothetical protein